MRNSIGPAAAIGSGVLLVAWLGGVDSLLVVFGVLGVLAYLAFAGGYKYKRKETEPKRPWYMD